MGGKIQIPSDFRHMARNHTTDELTAMYGVSVDTVYKWRKAYKIRPFIRRRKTTSNQCGSLDSPEQIRTCLTCDFAECIGSPNCPRFKQIKQQKGVAKPEQDAAPEQSHRSTVGPYPHGESGLVQRRGKRQSGRCRAEQQH